MVLLTLAEAVVGGTLATVVLGARAETFQTGALLDCVVLEILPCNQNRNQFS